MIGYSAAIRLLDNGRYDKHLAEGMEILACIMEAVESNWITLNIEKQIIVWRWLLAAVFITEEREKNGTVDVPNDEGGVDTAAIYSGEHGAISVYPGPERFALANHIEAGAIEKYGPDVGLQLALRMYQDMVVADEEHGFRLSGMGWEVFNMLHDGFIEQIQTEGVPEAPIMH
ncbi:hypothetical protein [Klebsiella variicola]|uniref:hypothetical protein n=1 Tax=Klebsiella variicola TaxID=244366 RepID=UPI00352851BF